MTGQLSRYPIIEDTDPVQAEVDSIDAAELHGDCAAVLDVLDKCEALTVAEIVQRVDFEIDAELRVTAALQQLRRYGAAESWWSTR